jgi:exonuclease III
MFMNNPYEKYDFFFNSTKNKRGVGILIKKNIPFSVLAQRGDAEENSILLHLEIKGSEVIFICIYGPKNVDPNFFNEITTYLENYRNLPVIMGGDWNATLCPDPAPNNIDCLNMARIPNGNHSNKIAFELSDPYRILYPENLEFTYQPRYALSQNKSLLDFFLISDTLLDFLSDCVIHPTVQNKLFDHKAVTLSFNKTKHAKKYRYAIAGSDLDDDLLAFLVHATVAETYLVHWADGQVDIPLNKNLLLNSCGTIKTLIRDCGPPFSLRPGTVYGADDVESRDRKIIRITVLCQSLNISYLETGHCSVTRRFLWRPC